MKSNGKVMFLFVTVLLVSVLLTYTPLNVDHQLAMTDGAGQEGTDGTLRNQNNNAVTAGIDHDPIKITGDQEFQDTAILETWGGEGIVGDPYIIEGYDIDRNGEDGDCILIANTTVHFVIRDCFLARANQSNRAGIWLTNVSNCLIENNVFFENRLGISGNTESCTIVDNTIIGIANGAPVDWAIWLQDSNFTSIVGNTMNVTDYGVRLNSCKFSSIEDNTIRDIDNRGVYVEQCLNVSIIDNECINNNVGGIYVGSSDNNVMTRNFCNGSLSGIYVVSLTDGVISECTLTGNAVGLLVTNAGGMLCTNNIITDSENQGIQIAGASPYNDYLWNTLKNNPVHIECLSPDNNIEYGYYDDYSGFDQDNDGFGDVPYYCDGTNPDADYHPLVFEPTVPVWDAGPIDHILEFGTDFQYALDVNSLSPIDDWYINDTSQFIIDDFGVINNKVLLDVGVYPLDVTATSVYGLSIEGTFTVTVEDTTIPIWISQVENKNYSYGDEIKIQIAAWDLAGIQSWVLSDSGNFTLTGFSYADTGVATITGSENLAIGVYPISLSVYDVHGNVAIAEFTVTVTEQTLGGTDGVGFIVSSAGLGIAVVALLLGLGAFLNTRKESKT